jgi:nucleoside-diphosphate-sugar epimerase
VKDMVEGIVSLMHSGLTQPVNFGNDNFLLYKDVADKIKHILGSSSAITFSEGLPYTHLQAVPDITLAKEKLNWFPLVSIDEGLKQTIAYARSNYIERPDIRQYGKR